MSTNGPAQRRYSRTPLHPQINPSADRYSTHRDARKPASRDAYAGPTFLPPRTNSRFAAGSTAAPAPVSKYAPRKGLKPSPAAKQPRSYQADVQWDNLRSQGYVLRGSVSMPTGFQSIHHQQDSVPESPNIRYVPDPVYRQSVSYQVHPNLRTTPHLAQPSGHPAPAAAFLSQARFAPAPQQITPYPSTPKRPKMHSQASSITMRTLRAQQDLQKCQLKPGNVFLYERPSKASYLESEEPISRYGSSRPSSRAGSASSNHHEGRSSSRLSRHSASLPFIPFQPDYPPTESLHGSLHLSSRPASRAAQSTPLLRQETDVSFYSQSTFPDSYAEAVQHQQQESLSRASTHRSTLSSSHRPSYPLDTARTEMTLGTAQDLWRDLYHELLSTGDADVSKPREPDYAGLQTPRQLDPEISIDGEYDFRYPSMALRSPSPVPIQRLKSTKKVRDSGSPTRPQLVRQTPGESTYEITGKQIIERAMRASSRAVSPKKEAMPQLVPASGRQAQFDDSSVKGHSSTNRSSGDTPAVESLTHQLRAKTPAAGMFEDSAMRQLALQSGPSEVDSEEECSLATPPSVPAASEEDQVFQTATLTSPVVAQGTLRRLSAVCATPQAVSVPQQRTPARGRASRIPVPIARRVARPRSRIFPEKE